MISNSLARGIMGKSTLNQGVSLLNLLDEEAIGKIAQSTWIKIWTIFPNFGTVSAGFIGVMIIIRDIILFWMVILLNRCYFGLCITRILLNLGERKENFEDQQKVQSNTNP